MTTVKQLAYELGFAGKPGRTDETYALRAYSGHVPGGVIPTSLRSDEQVPADVEAALRAAASKLPQPAKENWVHEKA